MMYTVKRMIAFLLVMVMVFNVMPMSAFASEIKTSEFEGSLEEHVSNSKGGGSRSASGPVNTVQVKVDAADDVLSSFTSTHQQFFLYVLVEQSIGEIYVGYTIEDAKQYYAQPVALENGTVTIDLTQKGFIVPNTSQNNNPYNSTAATSVYLVSEGYSGASAANLASATRYSVGYSFAEGLEYSQETSGTTAIITLGETAPATYTASISGMPDSVESTEYCIIAKIGSTYYRAPINSDENLSFYVDGQNRPVDALPDKVDDFRVVKEIAGRNNESLYTGSIYDCIPIGSSEYYIYGPQRDTVTNEYQHTNGNYTFTAELKKACTAVASFGADISSTDVASYYVVALANNTPIAHAKLSDALDDPTLFDTNAHLYNNTSFEIVKYTGSEVSLSNLHASTDKVTVSGGMLPGEDLRFTWDSVPNAQNKYTISIEKITGDVCITMVYHLSSAGFAPDNFYVAVGNNGQNPYDVKNVKTDMATAGKYGFTLDNPGDLYYVAFKSGTKEQAQSQSHTDGTEFYFASDNEAQHTGTKAFNNTQYIISWSKIENNHYQFEISEAHTVEVSVGSGVDTSNLWIVLKQIGDDERAYYKFISYNASTTTYTCPELNIVNNSNEKMAYDPTKPIEVYLVRGGKDNIYDINQLYDRGEGFRFDNGDAYPGKKEVTISPAQPTPADTFTTEITIDEQTPPEYAVALRFFEQGSTTQTTVDSLGSDTYTIEASDGTHTYIGTITGTSEDIQFSYNETPVESLPAITSWVFKNNGTPTDTLNGYEVTNTPQSIEEGEDYHHKVYVFEARTPKQYSAVLEFYNANEELQESVTLEGTYTLEATAFTTSAGVFTAEVTGSDELSWQGSRNYLPRITEFRFLNSNNEKVDKLDNYTFIPSTDMEPIDGVYHLRLQEPRICTVSVTIADGTTLNDDYDYYIVAKNNQGIKAYSKFTATAPILDFTSITRNANIDEETTFEVVRVLKTTSADSIADGSAFTNAADADKASITGDVIENTRFTWDLETPEGSQPNFAFTVALDLPEGVYRRVRINLYQEDGETLSDTVTTDLTGFKYFVRLYLYEKNADGSNGALLGFRNSDWILPANLNAEHPVDFSDRSFAEIGGAGNDLWTTGQWITYDETIHNLKVRLYQGDQYAGDQSIGNNSLTETVEGYVFKAPPNGNVTVGGITTLNLKKTYPREYRVVVKKGEDVDLNGLNLELYAEAKHQESTDYYILYDLNSMVSGTAAREEEYVCYDSQSSNPSNWTSQNADPFFSGNETTKARIVKDFNASSLTYKEMLEGEFIKNGSDAYIITYPEKTIADDTTTDPNKPRTIYTDYVKIDKVDVSNDYNFESILGSGVYYGITAQYFDQGGHIQSNFAANKYYPGNIVEPDLAGNGSMIVIADPIPAADGYYLEIGGSHVEGTDTVVYLGKNGTSENVRNVEQRTWVHVIPSETDDLNANIVQPIISHGIAMSNELNQHAASFNQTTNTIDLLDLPEDATIYLDGDALKDWISKSKDDGLYITKHENQTIVFNFDSTSDVTLGQYHIRYSRSDTYQLSHSPTGKGDEVNNFMDKLAQHMVFNCKSAKNVTINTCVGMVLVPRSDSYTLINGTSAGWIISNGKVHNDGAEWHSVYGQLPSSTKTNLTVGKTVDGNTPGKNQVFNFTLEHLNTTSHTWETVKTDTNKNGAVTFNDVALSNDDIGWNVFRISEGVKADGTLGDYVYDEHKVYAFVRYINVGSAKIALPPVYYITADEGDENTVFFKEESFNKGAETLTNALGTPEGDGVVELRKMSKPSLDNIQKKKGLNFAKKVRGPGNEEDTFTFLVTLHSPTEDDEVNTLIYRLKKSGNINHERIVFTRVENTDDFTAEVVLHKDQSANIDGIPTSVSYTITETKVNGKPITSGQRVDGYYSDNLSYDGVVTEQVDLPEEFINTLSYDYTEGVELNIHKVTDGDNEDEADAAGIIFTLGGTSAAGTALTVNGTTDADGLASFELTGAQLGKYDAAGEEKTFTLTETNVPAGYESNSPWAVKVTSQAITHETDANNKDVSVYTWAITSVEDKNGTEVSATGATYKIVNEKRVTYDNENVEIKIHKSTEIDDSDMENISFTLTKDGETEACASGTTDTNGKLTLLIPKEKLGMHNGADDTTTTMTFELTETIPSGYENIGPWTVTVIANGTNVEEVDNVTVITHKWTLESISGLTADAMTAVYEITNIPIYTSAMVQKIWMDDDNRDALRPASLRLELLADGDGTGRYVYLNEGNNWVDKIDNLPKYNGGDEIKYSWKEPTVVGYDLTSTVKTGTLTILTNEHKPPKTQIHVKKNWEGNDQDGTRPTSIDVQLFADGKAYRDPVKLDTSCGWEYTWTDLDVNACEAGVTHKIRYTVAETEIPEGYTAKITGNASDGFVITNTRETGSIVIEKVFDIRKPEPEPTEEEATTDITVTKIWDDNNNKDGNRPKSITVHLFAGGEEVRTAKLTEETGWINTFRNLPKFVNGKQISYSITEDPVEWYTAQINGFTIRNKYTPETTNVVVIKSWNDNNYENRPDSVRVTLSNGISLILSAANGWTGVVTGLPTRINGQPAVYTWTEQSIIGYTLESVVQTGHVTVITNKRWEKPDEEGGKTKQPGDTVIFMDEYDTPLGVDVIINHVGDCFD